MSEPQSPRPKQITGLAILWAILGVWNLWNAFQGVNSDLEFWNYLSNPLVPAWFRMAVPVVLGTGIVVLVAAVIQLLTVPLLLTRKPYSIKLALGVFITIAIINLVSGALYASAPPEIRSELTSGILQAFGLGIFQMIIVAYFWRDLNRPEVKRYFEPTQTQQVVPREEIVMQGEEKKLDSEPKFYCRYCGSENKRDAVFCDSCGRQLKES